MKGLRQLEERKEEGGGDGENEGIRKQEMIESFKR